MKVRMTAQSRPPLAWLCGLAFILPLILVACTRPVAVTNNSPPNVPRVKAQESPSTGNPAELFRNRVKKGFSFDGWPGRDGKMKAGIAFDPEMHAQLKGFAVSKDEFLMRCMKHFTTAARKLILKREKETISIRLFVSTDEIEEIHEVFIEDFSLISVGVRSMYHRRGEHVGYELGDVSFFSPGTLSGVVLSEADRVLFARNNIGVMISKSTGSTVDIPALSIDNSIKSQPDFNKGDFKNKLPRIIKFEAKLKEISPNSTTTIDLEATDPTGAHLEYLLWSDTGVVRRDEFREPPVITYFSHFGEDEALITAVVFNRALLFAMAETKVKIRKE